MSDEILRQVMRKSVEMEWVSGASYNGQRAVIHTNQAFEVYVTPSAVGGYRVSSHDQLSGAREVRHAITLDEVLAAIQALLDW